MSGRDNADAPDAYRKALGLLVRREHSRRDLRRKLVAKGVEAASGDAAIETLIEQGYQSDARFAEMLIRTRIGGGYGLLHIRAELGTHGIDPQIAAAALEEADPDWPELAREALRRRYGERPPEDRAQSLKRANFLHRRGFDGDSIRHATRAHSDP